MQAQAITFDTHAFVKRLTRAGMPEDQASNLEVILLDKRATESEPK